MERITTDIYSFENLRKGGYVYIAVKRSCVCARFEYGARSFFVTSGRESASPFFFPVLAALDREKRF